LVRKSLCVHAAANDKCGSANAEDCCRSDSNNRRTDVRALGELMQQLMENGTEKGRLGLRDPSRWSKDAVDFLSLTMTESAEKLSKVCAVPNGKCKTLMLTVAQHPFLKNTRTQTLVRLVSLALVSAGRFYSLKVNR
jgi:hypothetical protein